MPLQVTQPFTHAYLRVLLFPISFRPWKPIPIKAKDISADQENYIKSQKLLEKPRQTSRRKGIVPRKPESNFESLLQGPQLSYPSRTFKNNLIALSLAIKNKIWEIERDEVLKLEEAQEVSNNLMIITLPLLQRYRSWNTYQIWDNSQQIGRFLSWSVEEVEGERS